MEIKRTDVDELNFRLNLQIVKEDYADKKKKMLNDYRRKAELKGFRPGMAPMSLIEKMHGTQALHGRTGTSRREPAPLFPQTPASL